MALSIYRDMHLGAFALFMAVKSSPPAAFWRGLKCAAIQDNGAGIGLPGQSQTQDGPEIMGHAGKTARPNPTLGLLVNHVPRRQIWQTPLKLAHS
jgi:hypothetical protein